MKPASTTSIMRVPRSALAVPGRRAQYRSTGPESRGPQVAAGYDGARLSRAGVAAGEVHA